MYNLKLNTFPKLPYNGFKNVSQCAVFTHFNPQTRGAEVGYKGTAWKQFFTHGRVSNVLFAWNVAQPLAPPSWLNAFKNTALLRYSCSLIQLLSASYLIYRKTMAARCSGKVYGLAPRRCRKTSPLVSTAHRYWLGMIYIITIFLVKSRWHTPEWNPIKSTRQQKNEESALSLLKSIVNFVKFRCKLTITVRIFIWLFLVAVKKLPLRSVVQAYW